MTATGAAHATRGPVLRRGLPLALVAVVVVGLGLVDRSVSVPPRVPAISFATATAAPASAESSAWYCAGATVGKGARANAILYAANDSDQTVTGTVTAVSETGATGTSSVTVPADSQVVVPPASVATGNWVADSLVFDGGGVVVSQVVQGASGWAQAPCASGTSGQWLFPSGSTVGANGLFIALYNPTATPDVVDLSFVTPQGVMQAADFDGLVLGPGQLRVEPIGVYIQSLDPVSTIVSTRSGRVVAAQLQDSAQHGINGLALTQGASAPLRRWDLPVTSAVLGGTTTLHILNPTAHPEQVRVQARLSAVAPAPYLDLVAPDTTWTLTLAAPGVQSRIPPNAPYTLTVTATGPGVVVDRTVAASAAGPLPQTGSVLAIGSATSNRDPARWLVPAPGTPGNPAVPGAAPYDLGLSDASARPVSFRVVEVTPTGNQLIHAGSLAPGGFTLLAETTLTASAHDPILVEGSGPLAVMEDDVPAGAAGVVTMSGVPLAG